MSPDERKEAHSLDFPAARQSLSCMRDANLLSGRHPPAMRGLSGRRSSRRETKSGTKAQSQRRQTLHMDQEEVPEMWKRSACATENMRLRSRLFLNADWLRRGKDGIAGRQYVIQGTGFVRGWRASTGRSSVKIELWVASHFSYLTLSGWRGIPRPCSDDPSPLESRSHVPGDECCPVPREFRLDRRQTGRPSKTAWG